MNAIIESPVVIGGLGGSGTCLIADILLKMGIYLGKDLNSSKDNRLFTFLLKRSEWYEKHIYTEHKINRAFSILKKRMMSVDELSLADKYFLFKCCLDWTFKKKRKIRWSIKRLKSMLSDTDFSKHRFYGWGWKEPNSHIYIPNLHQNFNNFRYIHVIRHGLDMAYSKNQTQLRSWGKLFGINSPETPDQIPCLSLKFWNKVNMRAINMGRELPGNRFLLVNFDNLCLFPERETGKIIEFLKIDISNKKRSEINSLPRLPKSSGRYKLHSLNMFSNEDFISVRNFGFEIEI